MSIKKSMLAAALAALALAAAPGVASAYWVHRPGDGNFTVSSSGSTILRVGESDVECTSVTGSGQFEDKHSGSIQINLHGCKASGTKCTTSGSPSGTVTTTMLPFHVVEVTHEEESAPGMLITSDEGHVATFKCAFGLVHVEVGGNGVIGTLYDPGVSQSASQFKFAFEEDGESHQTHLTGHDTTETVNPETEYQIDSSINGGETVQSALIGNIFTHFTEGEGQLTDS